MQVLSLFISVAGVPLAVIWQEVGWSWVTLVLATVVAGGYVAIAFNWYFQRRLNRHRESRGALFRLCGIFAGCFACGLYLMATPDAGWIVWRAYDLVLLLMAVVAWRFVCRTRGMGLVEERLAQVQELEETARKYRDIAELLPHMVWMAKTDGDVDFSNRRWCQYAGDGRTWLDAVHPEERDAVGAWWRQAVASQQAVTREVRLGAAGHYRTFVVSASPIVRGDCAMWLGACADVEDQKVLAAEKESRARRQAFFLNALSHDLRAPLNNITLTAHVLKMSAANDPARLDSINMIHDSALAAGEMLNRLLEFGRVGAQEQNESTTFPVAAVLEQAARRFAPVAARKGLHLHIESGGGEGDGGDKAPASSGVVAAAAAGVQLFTDRQKLERVLNNLIDNAIKYTRQGGVSVGAALHEETLVIRVADTGIGIPQQSVPYLFDEFYQVHNHARDPVQGFGIGLAICRCLARQLGGDVRLDHTGPEGSCFEIILHGVIHAGADRGGRPGGAAGDHADPLPAGLCHI